MTHPEQIKHIEETLDKAFKLESKHLETLKVFESFQGKVVFDGDVEVFDITGHPETSRCYAWAEKTATGNDSTVILEQPPIKNALDAVRAALATKAKRMLNN
jgi:hypothetical protein